MTTSANLDLVRSIYAGWERGDYSSVEWAHPEIEYVILHRGGFSPVSAKGPTEMREAARANIEAWAQLRIAAGEYRVLDSERVLVLDDVSGRGKRSGLEIGQLGFSGAHLFHLRDGMVTRLVAYDDRDRALADLGLTPEADASVEPDRVPRRPCLVGSAAGLGCYEGQAAVRGFFEDWLGAYEEFEFELEQILDLGNGVVFAVVRQNARPVGSTGYVQMHHANVMLSVNGVTVRATHYNDIDEARAAAERLAEERG